MSVESPGTAVRAHRRRHGVSLRDLAARIGVSAATLSAIENGHTRLSVDRARDIAAALDIPTRALVDAHRPGPVPTPSAAVPVPGAPAAHRHWREFPRSPPTTCWTGRSVPSWRPAITARRSAPSPSWPA
ncbi:helix-turn-helix domain-containing protein [Tsukamurella soli]|uniref:helix-turn-helix domain-containing protein n=1 Tax=Tsukamurella soli TaxID=644556 RepID=UPI003615D7D9